MALAHEPRYASAARGEALTQSKLTEDDVRYARALVAKRQRIIRKIQTEFSNARIAAELGVAESTLEKVLYWETWTHVR